MKSQNKAQNRIVISGFTILAGLFSVSVQAADLKLEKKAKPAGSDLKYKQSKVPQFDLVQKKMVNGKQELVRAKVIPRLNLGEEAKLKSNDIAPLALPEEKPFKQVEITNRPTPAVIDIEKYLKMPIAKAGNAKEIIKVDVGHHAPEAPQFAVITVPPMVEPKPQLEKLEEMAPVQMKMLQALIFLEVKKDFPMALALFAELLDETSVKLETTYQLALTSKGLGLYSEYKFRMLQLLDSKDTNWQMKAAKSLAENAAEGDKELVATLDPKLDALKIELEKADQYQMNRAKYYLDRGDLTKAFSGVDEILMDSPLYIDALFLKSLILYKGNQIQEAIGLQQTVLLDVEAKRPASEFKSIVALTLARLHFQAGQYKEAFDNYLKVDKANPEWLQAMTEQAWSQILSEDYEGAAGNMFSLHTDFFKKSFTPESYVVRTVGYLNLCQYGDGAKVVYDFKKRYTPVLKQLQEYGDQRKDNVNYYDTIKTWAKNPDLQTVDGLPREFIFALTRHPSFILEQKMINSIEDQAARMNKISISLIKTERKALTAQSDARAQLISLKKKIEGLSNPQEKKTYQEQVSYQEKRLMSAKIQHYIAKKARTSIKDLRTDGLARLEKEKTHFRDLAGKAVRSRYSQMTSKLTETLDQSEVLQYELYSGAGDHIRYQAAGGDVNKKERAELKVDDGKSLNWDFRGEIWEDELGHYRSSLKNVCPPEEKLSSANLPPADNKN
ncbi:MAG: tetratricopeptide repeat protein [Pseudobdellovibrionaceae bacterium]